MCSELSRGERGDNLSVRLSVPAGGSLWARQLQDCNRDAVRATMSSCTVSLSQRAFPHGPTMRIRWEGEGTAPFLKLRK